MSDRELPPRDRTEINLPRKGERLLDYAERVAAEDQGIPLEPKKAYAGRPWRPWMGQPSPAERIDRIMAGLDPDTGRSAREPGSDDE